MLRFWVMDHILCLDPGKWLHRKCLCVKDVRSLPGCQGPYCRSIPRIWYEQDLAWLASCWTCHKCLAHLRGRGLLQGPSGQRVELIQVVQGQPDQRHYSLGRAGAARGRKPRAPFPARMFRRPSRGKPARDLRSRLLRITGDGERLIHTWCLPMPHHSARSEPSPSIPSPVGQFVIVGDFVGNFADHPGNATPQQAKPRTGRRKKA